MAQLLASEFLIFYTHREMMKPACIFIFSSLCILNKGLDYRGKYTQTTSEIPVDEGQHSYNRKGMWLNRDFTRGEANMQEALCTQNERDADAFLVV